MKDVLKAVLAPLAHIGEQFGEHALRPLWNLFAAPCERVEQPFEQIILQEADIFSKEAENNSIEKMGNLLWRMPARAQLFGNRRKLFRCFLGDLLASLLGFQPVWVTENVS